MHKKNTILIVDDLPSEVVLLGEVLTPNHEVLFATSGAQALELARRTFPDLIILDVVMPGMDGFEVCRRLKADPCLAAIPVLFLTVQDDPEREYTGLALGALDYLAKPVPPPLLLARVLNHLKLKALYEQQIALVAELRGKPRTRSRNPPRLCAWCQRIRTNEGRWTPRETLAPPGPALQWGFTVCPDCIRELMRVETPP